MLHRFRAHISAASALFAIVPLAAFLLVRNDSARDRIRWTLAHLVTLFGSLAVTFVLIELLFRLGVFPQSAVVSFEVEPLYKLWWFISGPVANALDMFALRDRFDTELGFWLAVLVTATVITLGVRLGPVRSRVDKWTWLFCLLLLPFAAHSVSSKREKGSHKGPSVKHSPLIRTILASFERVAIARRPGARRRAWPRRWRIVS